MEEEVRVRCVVGVNRKGRAWEKLEFQLALGTSTCSLTVHFPCPVQVLVCPFNDLVGRWLARSLAYVSGKWECKVGCPEETCTCPGQWDGTFGKPWTGKREGLGKAKIVRNNGKECLLYELGSSPNTYWIPCNFQDFINCQWQSIRSPIRKKLAVSIPAGKTEFT